MEGKCSAARNRLPFKLLQFTFVFVFSSGRACASISLGTFIGGTSQPSCQNSLGHVYVPSERSYRPMPFLKLRSYSHPETCLAKHHKTPGPGTFKRPPRVLETRFRPKFASIKFSYETVSKELA